MGAKEKCELYNLYQIKCSKKQGKLSLNEKQNTEWEKLQIIKKWQSIRRMKPKDDLQMANRMKKICMILLIIKWIQSKPHEMSSDTPSDDNNYQSTKK